MGLLNKEINLIQKIWSHDECLKFLKTFSEQYGKDILYWFNYEQDGRYKSDIVRLCILFEFGGIYVDVDQEPLISFSEYLDFNKYDFCAASNMGLHNVSNGFIYVKKNSNIIKNNIDEMILRYETNGPIGGCHSLGSTITKLLNIEPLKMPLGEIKIKNENCLFLHEIGNTNLQDETQEFYNSFGLYANNDKLRVMNSRYDTYHIDKYKINEFITI